MIDKNLVYIEIIFLLGVLLSVFIPKNLFLKILIVVVLFLFVLKEIDDYKYIKQKYLYVGYGFVILLALFIITEYINSTYFVAFLICLVVIYLYLFKIIFNTTYGIVTRVKSKKIFVMLNDPFYKSKKELELSYSGHIKKDDIVILELTKFPINKKVVKVINVVSNDSTQVMPKLERAGKRVKKVKKKK
jgi:vacuolar-type H+-ATPase subunit I/STV1